MTDDTRRAAGLEQLERSQQGTSAHRKRTVALCNCTSSMRTHRIASQLAVFYMYLSLRRSSHIIFIFLLIYIYIAEMRLSL